MSMDINLENQTAVVFGAGRGIGKAIAEELAKAGAVVYVADLILENCLLVKNELTSKGYKALACQVDVSDYNQVEGILKTAERETGKLDIVVNNAGIVSLTPFLDTTTEEFQKLININLIGVNNGLQSAIKIMKKYGHGKIVSTSSFSGRHALQAGFAHYGTTKAGVIYLTQAGAYAGADYCINVNAVCPGIIRTPMWEKILDNYVAQGKDREEAWQESLKNFIPLALGDQKPEDIAYAVLFLCSKYADHITGQSLNVDGGAAMN